MNEASSSVPLRLLLPRTSLLVYRQLRDARAGAPCGNIRHLIDQFLHARPAPPLVFQRQDDTEVLGQPTEALDIAADQLGSPVVMVVYRVYLGRNGMVGLAEADEDGEEDVDDGEDEDVVLAADEAAHAQPGHFIVSCFRRARPGS